jgi:hypothetical protein
MTKTRTFILFLLVGLIGLLSFAGREVLEKGGLEKGDRIKVDDSKNMNVIANLLKEGKGNYVLVNFWATYDAQSHIDNIRFARVVDAYKDCSINQTNGLVMVSVSFDTFQSVFVETIRRDALPTANIYEGDGFNSQMARNFELTEGCFGNYLIDEQGVIVAKNVTPEEFEQIIREKI